MRWYYYVIVAFFLLLSAFYSTADMVYGAVDQTRLEKAAEKGSQEVSQESGEILQIFRRRGGLIFESVRRRTEWRRHLSPPFLVMIAFEPCQK